MHLRLVALATALIAVGPLVPAHAEPLPSGASNVVAAPQGGVLGYAPATTVTTVGTTVSLLNADLTAHDVTSRTLKTIVVRKRKVRVPLFQSPSIGAGASGEITGSAQLPAGEYDFYCSFHPAMTGKLVVR